MQEDRNQINPLVIEGDYPDCPSERVSYSLHISIQSFTATASCSNATNNDLGGLLGNQVRIFLSPTWLKVVEMTSSGSSIAVRYRLEEFKG